MGTLADSWTYRASSVDSGGVFNKRNRKSSAPMIFLTGAADVFGLAEETIEGG